MILLDMFSGIGGFHKGLTEAGFTFKKVYYSEIDKHAIANYKYNYEKAEHIGAVEHILTSKIKRPDIITFGSPCQDFSIAGKRAGLGGTKSNLISYAISAISHFRPNIFIWENVKGAFTSNNSEDFWAIIKAFADIGDYECEWQLVNTSWLLPQNRERIYLVGHLAEACGDWKPIFPVTENDKIFEAKNETKGRRTQTENCTTIKNNFGNKADDTFIIQLGHGFMDNSINDICPTIRSNSFEYNTSVLSYTRDGKGNITSYNERGIAGTIKASSGGTSNTSQYVISEPTHKHGDEREYTDIVPTISSLYSTGGDNIPYVNSIRRLTEIECERLQGFPENWTKYGNYNGTINEIAKTQRYKLLGNAVTAKMVELIGIKIFNNLKNRL